jgi:hypothetical protein
MKSKKKKENALYVTAKALGEELRLRLQHRVLRHLGVPGVCE